ncbi:hypothetical protein DO97_21430 [Neosynechococcus sphagnicola sy1]|uniref:Transposase n=1 Tax=Neosynechococcus sphagnicola sy1 TaxID=1497020 RepID=A0A098TRD6_9CYAN|nr:hypothetical protein [Neosynechococcus sphagnicola]KGF73358.1 hypothetical protein DO97_21430 [Neosynechococcus sphagnicola sy1]
MIIVGLDVCESSVVACSLTEKPAKPLDWFRENRSKIPILTANKEGIDQLIEMKPDYVVLEPTGVNYSRLWATWLDKANVPILWVGHAQLRGYRMGLKLPSKNDQADALALAVFAFDHLNDPEYFLRFEIFGIGATIRSLGLQLKHLNRVANPIVNRLRQNLAHEWPEMMNRNLEPTKNQEAPTMLRFICGEELSKRSYTIYSRSLTSTVGSGLSNFSLEHAKRLLNLENQQISIERLLCEHVYSDSFKAYNAVFDRFGFGRRIRGILLSYCYPFESFLNQNGNEIKEKVRSRNGKRGVRYRSLAAFKLSLGYGMVENSSGSAQGWILGGSKLCRIALWQWVFTRIEVKSKRLKNSIGEKLGRTIDLMKDGGTPAALARSRIAAKACQILFYELLSEFK